MSEPGQKMARDGMLVQISPFNHTGIRSAKFTSNLHGKRTRRALNAGTESVLPGLLLIEKGKGQRGNVNTLRKAMASIEADFGRREELT